jgi:hypothetical protein
MLAEAVASHSKPLPIEIRCLLCHLTKSTASYCLCYAATPMFSVCQDQQDMDVPTTTRAYDQVHMWLRTQTSCCEWVEARHDGHIRITIDTSVPKARLAKSSRRWGL